MKWSEMSTIYDLNSTHSTNVQWNFHHFRFFLTVYRKQAICRPPGLVLCVVSLCKILEIPMRWPQLWIALCNVCCPDIHNCTAVWPVTDKNMYLMYSKYCEYGAGRKLYAVCYWWLIGIYLVRGPHRYPSLWVPSLIDQSLLMLTRKRGAP